MRKRIIGYSLVFIVFFLLDAVFVPVKIYGIGPSFLFSAVISIAMVEKERFGAIYGLVFGLFIDFSSSSVFGVNALIFMITGYLIGIIVHQKMSISAVSAFFVTFVSTVITESLLGCLYTFFYSEMIDNVFLYIVLPRTVLTVPTVIITYPIIKLMGKLFARHEEREGIW